MTAQEQWAPIPGYEGSYEASDRGRVRSLDRITDRGRKWRGKIMTPYVMDNGYAIVTLWRAGTQRPQLVHRLVLAAFYGKPKPGQEARHLNGDQADNRLSNLQWGTHSENQFDQVDHGTHPNAALTHCPSGHPYDDENTYVYPNGRHRACRTCRAKYAREWQSRKTRKAA